MSQGLTQNLGRLLTKDKGAHSRTWPCQSSDHLTPNTSDGGLPNLPQ